MRKVAFNTLGCKVNQYETEAMIEAFLKSGYTVVNYNDFADIYIINTCAVTNEGERKSRQIIRRAVEINPKAFVVVCGCYTQISSDKALELEGVGLVLGTNERANIVAHVENAIYNNSKVNLVCDIMQIKEFEEMGIDDYKSKTRAFIKIQDGCDQYCSYCIIPYTRGHARSRRIDNILSEVKNIEKNGFLEIVLTGIHIGSYGKDIGGISLIDVIERIHEFEGIKRIRMSSLEPRTFTDEFIKRLSSLKKVCHHFHLSLQSGCDDTLRRMNRKYTTYEYKDVVKKLREIYKDVAITTDIIVGFPGETDEEFKKTSEFVEEIDFSSIHVFKFSPKKGTKAYSMQDQIHPNIKDIRSKIITKIAQESKRKFEQAFVGSKMDVLYEQNIDVENGLYEGFTDNYIKIVSYSAYDISGKIVSTNLKEYTNKHIIGEL